MPNPRERWFAEVLRAGIDTKQLSEQDILSHATPSVLTAALPREVMAKVIEATLASGTMSHKAVVEVVTLALLAEKVPPPVTWSCVAAAAERGGTRDGVPKDQVGAREWVRRMLASALDTAVVTPKDLLAQATPSVLATSLPEGLTAKLLEVTLAAGKMSPEIIVNTIGVDNLAAHVSTKVLWAAFAKVGEAPGPTTVATADKKKGEFVDDEVSSVLVELEGLDQDAKPEPKPDAKPAAAARPDDKAKQPARPA